MKIGGKYRIYETLGNGAFGKTHKVTNFRDPFALKEIAVSAILDETGVNKELENHENLPRHEHVVTLIDHFNENNNLYVVFDFYEPGNLNDFAIHEKMDHVAITRAMRDIVHGLQHLHKHGVVHGNVKPHNILLEISHGNKPIFKISDFNLTKYASTGEARTAAMAQNQALIKYSESECGTVLFWPPEFKEGEYGKAGDVFSVGVVVYALFQMRVEKKVLCPVLKQTTGKEEPMFLSMQDDIEAALKVLTPANLTNILNRMLALSPGDRPTFEEVASTFE